MHVRTQDAQAMALTAQDMAIVMVSRMFAHVMLAGWAKAVAYLIVLVFQIALAVVIAMEH